MRLRRVGALFSILTACVAFGQTTIWDTSGNGMLNGTYYFREVGFVASPSDGSLNDAVALYDTIVFDGNGKYSGTAHYLDEAQGQIQAGVPISGTYSIGAGGFGFLTDPLQSGVALRGMVSNGIFIGSSTESSGGNTLLIAAQIPSPAPTVSTFNGAYSMAYMYYPYGLGNSYFTDAQFALNPNGAGNLGTVSMRGYYSGNGATVTGQVSQGIKYFASGGAIVITFPIAPYGSLSLVNGQEYLYFSPDGNFVFGGSPQQADMLIGVRTPAAGAPPLLNSSLYYNAGVYSDATNMANGVLDLNTYYGSFSLTSGTVIQHSRLFSALNGTYSSVTTGLAPTTAGATYKDPYDNFTISDGGNVRIGFGVPPYLGIDVALAAPSFSGAGVYLNPVGVVNAGSYAPFTTGLSPGELIVLTGTNLAPNTSIGPGDIATTSIFPTKLNNVQVLVDGVAAPLYYVSATQIAAIVPFAASQLSIATVQVKNNGVLSNTVTEFMNSTTPGVLTSPANGISAAAALHADYSLVSEQNPAVAGETISVYLTGLGAVFPLIQDGYPGSSDPSSLNNTAAKIAALVGGVSATVGYAGLAPGYAGLYQINLTIPTGLTAGDNPLDIEGPDSYSSEALLPIGSGVAGGAPSLAGAEVQNGQAQKPAKHGKPRPSQKSVVVNPVQP